MSDPPVHVHPPQYPTTDIFVTGHSLGGALADFCALDLKTYLKAGARG